MKIGRFLSYIFCVLFLLPACVHKHVSDKRMVRDVNMSISPMQEVDTNASELIYQESLLVDIPIPLYDERIKSAFWHEIKENTSTLVLGYRSPLAATEAIDFFVNQMERHGWKHLVTFHGPRDLVQFKAPGRYCTIVIQEEDKGVSIFIYAMWSVEIK